MEQAKAPDTPTHHSVGAAPDAHGDMRREGWARTPWLSLWLARKQEPKKARRLKCRGAVPKVDVAAGMDRRKGKLGSGQGLTLDAKADWRCHYPRDEIDADEPSGYQAPPTSSSSRNRLGDHAGHPPRDGPRKGIMKRCQHPCPLTHLDRRVGVEALRGHPLISIGYARIEAGKNGKYAGVATRGRYVRRRYPVRALASQGGRLEPPSGSGSPHPFDDDQIYFENVTLPRAKQCAQMWPLLPPSGLPPLSITPCTAGSHVAVATPVSASHVRHSSITASAFRRRRVPGNGELPPSMTVKRGFFSMRAIVPDA